MLGAGGSTKPLYTGPLADYRIQTHHLGTQGQEDTVSRLSLP